MRGQCTHMRVVECVLLLSTFLVLACITPKNSPNPAPSNNPPIGPASCSAGQEWCEGRCVDTITFVNDSGNCGRCGNHCSFSETCNGGFCGCAPGTERCEGRCVDMITFVNDSENCGRCGNHCSFSETCNGGFCGCAPGTERCMGTCVNTASFLSDSQNCGRCGNSCFAGESCVGGLCRKL